MNIKKSNDAFHQSSIKVPFFAPWITRDDKKAVLGSLNAPLLTDGPKLREFEKAFCKFTGAKFAIGVSNATSALHLSLKALGIGKGDEVIVPDMTFVATANAVVHTGATPVLVDVEKDDMNISIESIERNLTSKTRAILPVHFAGKVCNIKEIMRIARSNKLLVIEDCAHAIGARFEGKHVGNFGNVGCFSFYPTKNITTIEGGMVITNSSKIAKYVMSARNHGITKSLSQRYSKGKPWEYDILESGYNFRLDEVRASLGLSQLKRIRKLNLMRRKAFQYYNSKLQKIDGIITPKLGEAEDNVFHLYIAKIQSRKVTRDKMFKKLLQSGIRTSVHYKPLHEFSVFSDKVNKNENLNNSKSAYNEIISLPFYPNITKKQQNLVVNSINEIMRNSNKN